MILHTCICTWPKEDPIDFGDKRSKFKVKLGFWTRHLYSTIIQFPFDIQWCYFSRVGHDGRRTHIDCGTKGQRSRSNSYFPHDNSIYVCHIMIIHYTCCLWLEDPNGFCGKKIQRSMSNCALNFALFLHDSSFTFWDIIILLPHVLSMTWREPILFGQKVHTLFEYFNNNNHLLTYMVTG